jgi:S-adenosylmethionine decarboxylase
MTVDPGCEWLVDAYGCDPAALQSREILQAVFDRVVAELGLQPVAPPLWHHFPDAAGLTGVVVLSESHLACHTFPERGFAAFNLYCCRPRPAWPWAERLAEALGATDVAISTHARGRSAWPPAGGTAG